MISAPGSINDRPHASRLDGVIEFLMIALLIAMPAARGTVNAFGEMFAIGIGAAIALLLVVRRIIIPQRTAGGWILWVPIALFILQAAAQLAPLSARALQSISPGTYAFKADLLSDLPGALASMPITFYALGTHHDLRIVLLAIVIFATVLTIYRDPQRIRRLLIAITLIGAAMAMLALAQDLSGTNWVCWSVDIGERARAGTFVNHSHFGQFMNLSIAAAIALLLTQPRRANVIVPLLLFIALGWLTIVISWTRGGMISAVIAAFFVLIGMAVARGRYALAAFLVVPLVAAIIAPMWIRDYSRLNIARDVWVMTSHFGRTGTGLGTFEWAYTPFDTSGSFNTTAYADNEYVQTLAEMGFAGLAIVLLFAGVIWCHWLRAVRSGDRIVAGIAIGAGYGVLAVMVHSMTDFGQHLATNACLSAILCGLIVNLGGEVPVKHGSRTWRGLSGLAVIAVTAWAVMGAARACIAEARWHDALRVAGRLDRAGWAAPQHRIDELLTFIDGAVDAEPGNVMYRYRRALYGWRIAAQQFDPGTPERLAAAKDAVDRLNLARRICPTYGLAYNVLGQLEISPLDLPIGYKHLAVATRLEPNDPLVWFAAGRVEARRGQIEEANRRFRHALDLEYSMIHDIIKLYADELHQPDALLQLTADNPYRMRFVANGFMARPQYAELGAATWRRANEVTVEQARRAGTPERLAAAGGALIELERFAEADEFYREAIRRNPNQPGWRVGHAQALVELRRFDDAAAELQTAERLQPDVAGLADVRKLLEAARTKPPTAAK